MIYLNLFSLYLLSRKHLNFQYEAERFIGILNVKYVRLTKN